MRASLFLSSLFLAAPVFAQGTFEFFMDQRNLDGGGFIRSVVTQEDSMTSPMPVPEGGSEFVLWAVESSDLIPTPIWTHIGTEVVGAYLPKGEMVILTNDPYTGGIPRTRIDQPFTLTYTVTGLQPDNAEAPPAAKKVIFDHRASLTILTDTVAEPDPNATPDLVLQGEIVQNGSESEPYYGHLPGDDIYTESGIETFTLNALADGRNAPINLATAQVQIWPLATATFSGIEDGAKYTTVPAFTVELKKVYPDSETYLQIYPGPSTPGTVGTKFNGGLTHRDTKSRDGRLSFPSIANTLGSDGEYTLEVITKTPFGEEILDTLSFEYDNTLDIRAGINALD